MSDEKKAEPVMYCWGKPVNTNKFHIFHKGRSLCMAWGFFNPDEPVDAEKQTAKKSDCKECVRRFNKALGFKTK